MKGKEKQRETRHNTNSLVQAIVFLTGLITPTGLVYLLNSTNYAYLLSGIIAILFVLYAGLIGKFSEQDIPPSLVIAFGLGFGMVLQLILTVVGIIVYRP